MRASFKETPSRGRASSVTTGLVETELSLDWKAFRELPQVKVFDAFRSEDAVVTDTHDGEPISLFFSSLRRKNPHPVRGQPLTPSRAASQICSNLFKKIDLHC